MRDNMATNKVYCSYQEIIDLHTEPEKVTAIGIHTPTDDTPYKMFEGFFKQFKKYKYIGASVSLIPVATLPIDPLQVEFPGNEGVDPRDIMNPVLFHGCHGEDMGTVLNMLIGRDTPISDSLIGMQGNNADGAPTSEYLLYSLLDELYYKALTDRTWRKAHPQRGFKKSGLRPLLYTLATNRQVAPGSLSDVLGFNDDDDVVAFGGDPTIADRTIINPVTGQEITVPTYATKNNMQLMTPRLTRLGYLDTRMLVTDFTPGVATVDTMVTSENWTRLPKLMMGLILLPPSYKVEMHFRMIINHYWTFKGFRGISFRNDLLKSPSYFNANDDLFANESGNGNPIPEILDPDSGDDPDPDPPTPPEPPVAGGVVLLDSLYSGGITLPDGSGDYSAAYATMNDTDGNDYTVVQSVFTQGTMTTGFFCKQNMTDGMIGYILRFASSTTVYYYDGTGATSRSDVVDIVYYNGAFALHTDSNNWITNATNIQPVNVGPVLEFSMTPSGAPSAVNVGTNYVFEGVSYGS